ncbi:hypothetical protein BJ322DRAFT_1154205 [Thelephora terrestris]|uniref:Uncharacterized protein n=1 Tax=Thelephora terrestris TaxID=56493 RepID=A0A9P6LC69_9AGAM|nr:hypothetical protein BJ322DRAFT_1154205 [Thelephora terrestris]
MALKDYYVEKAVEDSGLLIGEDSWAVKYINIGRARTIMEAFDDDASWFITVNEVNNYTRSRPLNWSLPHWIAYWAIGDFASIEEIFDAMIRLAYQVLPENRRGVNMRISTTESTIKIRFELLLEKAESKCLLFIPDAHGQTLFPMFYLSLKRDLEIISLARKHVLTDHETYESLVTILLISGAALDRIKSLRSIFEQQSPDNPRTHPDLSLFASRVPPKRGFGGGTVIFMDMS